MPKGQGEDSTVWEGGGTVRSQVEPGGCTIVWKGVESASRRLSRAGVGTQL